MSRPPIILCSGSLGSIELSQKIEAAAEAGFDGISVYGNEVRAAVEAGIDCGSLAADLGLMVAEVDGVVVTSRSTEHFDEALDIADRMAARSITMVETRAYDPADDRQVSKAAEVFGELCDRAALAGRLVHIEPFAWSSLGRTADAAGGGALRCGSSDGSDASDLAPARGSASERAMGKEDGHDGAAQNGG